VPKRKTVLPCRAAPIAAIVTSRLWLPVLYMPEPSHLQKSGSGYGWLLPVTVARPQRIFTAFRFLSQYLHISYHNIYIYWYLMMSILSKEQPAAVCVFLRFICCPAYVLQRYPWVSLLGS